MSLSAMTEKIRLLNKKQVFTLQNRIAFYERISALLESGVRPFDCLKDMKDEFVKAGVKESNSEYKMLSYMLEGFGNTNRIEMAIADYIPSHERIIISAAARDSSVGGEGVAKGFVAAAQISERMRKLRMSMAREIMMPIVILVLFMGLAVGGYYLFDMFVEVHPLHKWDSVPAAFYEACKLFVDNLAIILIAMVVLIFAMHYWIVTVPRTGAFATIYDRSRPYLDRVPPFSIYRLFNAFSFLTAFSGLMHSLTPKEALLELRKTASPYLQNHIDLMLAELIDANPGNAVTTTGLFDLDTRLSISIISKTKQFKVAVEKAAEKSLERTENQLKKVIKVINFTSLVFFAGFIFWAAISLMLFVSSMSANMY